MVDLKRQVELREAIELLFYGYRAFTSKPDRILEKRGLGRVHHRILYFIGREPGLSVNDLLDVLQISKQALHAPLRQLIAMELISNEKSSADRRVRELRLTTAGGRLEAQLTGSQQQQLLALFEQAGPRAELGWRQVMTHMAVAGRRKSQA